MAPGVGPGVGPMSWNCGFGASFATFSCRGVGSRCLNAAPMGPEIDFMKDALDLSDIFFVGFFLLETTYSQWFLKNCLTKNTSALRLDSNANAHSLSYEDHYP